MTLGAGGTLDIGTADGFSQGFMVPRDGAITAVSGFYTLQNAQGILADRRVIISVEVYRSSAPSPTNVFSPIAGTLTDLLPALIGAPTTGTTYPAGTVGSAVLTLATPIPVSAGDRLLLVGKIRMENNGQAPYALSMDLFFNGAIAIS